MVISKHVVRKRKFFLDEALSTIIIVLLVILSS